MINMEKPWVCIHIVIRMVNQTTSRDGYPTRQVDECLGGEGAEELEGSTLEGDLKHWGPSSAGRPLKTLEALCNW